MGICCRLHMGMCWMLQVGTGMAQAGKDQVGCVVHRGMCAAAAAAAAALAHIGRWCSAVHIGIPYGATFTGFVDTGIYKTWSRCY